MKKVLLVGLGRVGWAYDLIDSNKYRNTYLTHFKSLKHIQSVSPHKFEIYVHDLSQEVRNHFLEFEESVQFLQTEDEIQIQPWDLVIIATNTNQILSTVERISVFNKETRFLIEKPVAENIHSLTNFMAKHKETNLLERIRVGFPRRTLESSRQVKEILLDYSKENLSFEIRFTGGVSNILSHFIDLMEYWFGNLSLFSVNAKEKFAILKGLENPNLEIEVYQRGRVNLENTTIVSKDKSLFSYLNSGRFIEIYDPVKKYKRGFHGEIEQMLLAEAIEYVKWGLYGESTVLPRLPSPSLEIALVLEDAFESQ